MVLKGARGGILDRLKRLKELRTFLLSLTAYKGLYVYTTSIAEEKRSNIDDVI